MLNDAPVWMEYQCWRRDKVFSYPCSPSPSSGPAKRQYASPTPSQSWRRRRVAHAAQLGVLAANKLPRPEPYPVGRGGLGAIPDAARHHRKQLVVSVGVCVATAVAVAVVVVVVVVVVGEVGVDGAKVILERGHLGVVHAGGSLLGLD